MKMDWWKEMSKGIHSSWVDDPRKGILYIIQLKWEIFSKRGYKRKNLQKAPFL